MTTPSLRRPAIGGPMLVILSVSLALYFGRVVLIPLALAITLAFILTPVVSSLQKFHLNRTAATLLVICVLLAGAGYAGSIVASQFLTVIGELPNYRDNIHAKAASLRGPFKGTIRHAAETVDEVRKEVAQPPASVGTQRTEAPVKPVPVQVVDTSSGLLYLRTLLNPLITPTEHAGVAVIFTIFILIKREDLRNRLFRLVGLGRLSVMTEAIDDAGRRVSRTS